MVMMCTTLLSYSLTYTGLCHEIVSNKKAGLEEKTNFSISGCLSVNEQYILSTVGLIFSSLIDLCHDASHDLSAKASEIITH